MALYDPLHALCVSCAKNDILVEMGFSTNFPVEPPSIRVVRPRFVPNTGKVRTGGSVDVDMVARNAWIPGMYICVVGGDFSVRL